MTEKEFFNTVSNGSEDVLQLFLEAVSSAGASYCLIGGLAVNAYAEPVVSLDLDVVVAAEDIERVCKAARRPFQSGTFPPQCQSQQRQIFAENPNSDRSTLPGFHRQSGCSDSVGIQDACGKPRRCLARQDLGVFG